jgi:hypothetical protein
MGSKKTKTTQTNKPVYDTEIQNANRQLSSVYAQQAPKIQGYADEIGSQVSGLLERYREGDSGVNAARNYVTQTLESGAGGSNPYLDDMIALTNDNTRRSIQTQLGTRGGIGGSAERDIISQNLAEQELGLRYQDYDANEQRKAQAAALSGQVVAADNATLTPALAAAEFASTLPLNAASQFAAGTGGLLGQYQDIKGTQKQSGGFFGDLLGTATSLGGAYLGGLG